MKKDGKTYYKFPAALMYGFWESEAQKTRCLNNVLNYCAYDVWCHNGRGGQADASEFYGLICKELGLSKFAYDSKNSFYSATKELRSEYDPDIYNGLYWCISATMFFEFYENEKTAEERAGLLAYLATRSIIGQRGYAKTNKYFLTSRMACNMKNEMELPEGISKYRLRYHFDKLKTMLYAAFNVAIYSDKTMRGFYVSLKKDADGKPDILWLAQQVERIRDERLNAADPLKVALLEAKSKIRHLKNNENST